ncbi:phosphoribosyl-AMP cyclohydrolase [Telmatospirillum sp.]|uniref:phosphoribosyl-AMP cyclohydrolase n=1 Tax=Telmatospirillum sp. TaxID=2079197 RepID=UPI00284ECF8B|nr:phosphoribosyl-AMP cyclohydrolase [Telmatospirillum sp.]MDR3435708.1 phosphoribosyl-AMP cyclohydrolase [Telmatospirillum sp.]
MIDPAPALAVLKFNEDGLVPVIAQQHDSGEVLMMAWMNREAVAETLRTGQVCYYSRSRKTLWRKGETSGQRQRLVSFLIDCDGDTILLKVDQQGVACHTGHRDCFFTAVGPDGLMEISSVLIAPSTLYGK